MALAQFPNLHSGSNGTDVKMGENMRKSQRRVCRPGKIFCNCWIISLLAVRPTDSELSRTPRFSDFECGPRKEIPQSSFSTASLGPERPGRSMAWE